MSAPATRRAAFRKLHQSGCFVIPNPWDRGSAVYLAQLGFPALATSSAGFAFSRALPDAPWALDRAAVLAHVADVVAATPLPVNADFQSGYAPDPDGVAESVRLCVETGVAGLSIEDATGEPARPLYDLRQAVERIQAARSAIDATQSDVLLTARAECFLTGHASPLEESLRRLRAYAEAGADVLYAPGVRARDAIRTMVEAVAPKPVNVLVSGPGLRVEDLAALGVRRVSVGSALARVAWTALMAAAREIAEAGTFERFDGLVTTGALSKLFGTVP
ncbi:MAG TPA: isocitrate lyase/phosphoenolpyruvate mutase family protein [Myxococcota bacterium]|jgi:2-methylisocitrate lyase-like PEP mutase family enzyme|nr:isocitrate lyase/phosphoenolpyruvate mutase family protein [Myxococcota bacterium]